MQLAVVFLCRFAVSWVRYYAAMQSPRSVLLRSYLLVSYCSLRFVPLSKRKFDMCFSFVRAALSIRLANASPLPYCSIYKPNFTNSSWLKLPTQLNTLVNLPKQLTKQKPTNGLARTNTARAPATAHAWCPSSLSPQSHLYRGRYVPPLSAPGARDLPSGHPRTRPAPDPGALLPRDEPLIYHRGWRDRGVCTNKISLGAWEISG